MLSMQLFIVAVATAAAMVTSARVQLRGLDPNSAGTGNTALSEAILTAAAVEDVKTSHILCRVQGTDGGDFATVRLQKANNERSLVFNDDVAGVETKVRCAGEPDASCFAAKPVTVQRAEDCPACPCAEATGDLYGPYARDMAATVDKHCQASSGIPRMRVLLLGLGAGELATHMVKRCDAMDLDAVELDGRLPVLAHSYFGLPSSNVRVTVGDALPIVLDMKRDIEGDALLADQKKYDVVLVDCFSTGGVVPEHCRRAEFVQALQSMLREGGEVLHHVWRKDDRYPEVPEEYQGLIATYNSTFTCKDCSVSVRPLSFNDGVAGPDSIIFASGLRATSAA